MKHCNIDIKLKSLKMFTNGNISEEGCHVLKKTQF